MSAYRRPEDWLNRIDVPEIVTMLAITARCVLAVPPSRPSRRRAQMSNEFSVGLQPCQNFSPQIEHNEHAQWENRHECFCGHGTEKPCTKTVSFCTNCYRDHHEGGYENCVCGGLKTERESADAQK